MRHIFANADSGAGRPARPISRSLQGAYLGGLGRVVGVVIAAVMLTACASTATGAVTDSQLAEISLPPGFEIDVYTDRVPGARSLERAENGVLFVSTRSTGRVYAVVDRNGDFRPEEVYTIASGLRMPNGIAYRDGSLWVAEVSRIWRYDNILEQLSDPPEPALVYDELPSDRSHGWKYMEFGPDGRLYVPVGMPCNVCDPDNEVYGTILAMEADGSNVEIYAEGVRNTVGFDWHPETGDLWFTDNGRDWMGDNRPPDELNHAPESGLHFGFPYLHGADIQDPDYWSQRPSGLEIRRPVQELGPHVAALGMLFYEGSQFPAEYRNQIFIAEHGSWNRSVPIGYRVTLVRFHGDGSTSYETFAEGWLRDNGRDWGRPVDVLEMPDGSLLVSDDQAGAVYRIRYDGG